MNNITRYLSRFALLFLVSLAAMAQRPSQQATEPAVREAATNFRTPPPQRKLSGQTIRAWWYNPREGTSIAIREFEKTSFRDFTPPSGGPGNDWALVLDDASKNFPPPGKGVLAR